MSLYGIDVAEFQAVGVQGSNFTIIRATYGTGYVDKKCDQHYQLAKKQGKLRGVYHYAYPQFNKGTAGAKAEANWFVKNIKGYIGDALLVLDWEEGDKTNVKWAKAFLDQVYKLTGVRPLIYMSASVTTSANWSPVAKDYALWCAGYPARFNVANPPTPKADGSDMPFNTGAWKFATIWQYSSSAGKLDRDIAYMTKAAWGKFAAINKPAPPKKEPNEPAKPPVKPAPPAPAKPVEPPSPKPEPPVVTPAPVQPTPTPAPGPVEKPPVKTPAENGKKIESPSKVVVPEPTCYTIWELIKAILKKIISGWK